MLHRSAGVIRARILLVFAFLGLTWVGEIEESLAAADTAVDVINMNCGGCHAYNEDANQWFRISQIRKTPEGWAMTIDRMLVWHGVQVNEDDRRTIIKYLADNQGLAPLEAEPYRSLLEQRHNTPRHIENGDVGAQCAGCHSYGRVALQRRDAEEWRRLVHTHVGQFPSAEARFISFESDKFKEFSRSLGWFEIADKYTAELLGELYPLHAKAWADWRSTPKDDLSGLWGARGYWPGRGPYFGTVKITAASEGKDHYDKNYSYEFASGETWSGVGVATVYTGYEWRGVSDLEGARLLETLTYSRVNQDLQGRVFLADANELGADYRARKLEPARAQLFGAAPEFVVAGEKSRVSLYGYKLKSTNNKIDFGPGVEILNVQYLSDDKIILEVLAAPGAPVGQRDVRLGSKSTDVTLSIVKKVDAIRVAPANALARVGGGGGQMAPVGVQFEAVAYENGPDGKPETKDDLRLGAVPVRWSIEPWDEAAGIDEDDKFAGVIGDDGLFRPAAAGPNPRRKNNKNNYGNLKIIATYKGGDAPIEASAHLVVGPQKFVNSIID
ncbi:MAG: quinohemoprotein amine dehydrogenase subunit alpha [Amphiplicatus sp.]